MRLRKKKYTELDRRLWEDSHRENQQNNRIVQLEIEVADLKAQIKKLKKWVKNGY